MSVPARAYLSIGEVLTKLRGDFPDITISKIRFLESEGLIDPQRTPSGYRKFTGTDLERLRYVLLAQRDQYLPLRVIKENLDALDRGLQPAPTSGGVAAPRPSLVTVDGEMAPSAFGESSDMRLSREELLKASGFKSAADREIGLIEQVITPLTRQKNTESKARAEEVQKEIASLSIRLHASLVRGGLNRLR